MNIKISGVFAGVTALFAATSASAATLADDGHFEWRPGIQAPGPRATIAGPRRVWESSAMAMNEARACDRMMAARSAPDTMSCCVTHHS